MIDIFGKEKEKMNREVVEKKEKELRSRRK